MQTQNSNVPHTTIRRVSTHAGHAAVQTISTIKRRIPLRIVLIVAGILLLVIVFFSARSEGIKQGQRDARAKIEAENDLLAGPNSLLQ